MRRSFVIGARQLGVALASIYCSMAFAQDRSPCEQFSWSVSREIAAFSGSNLQGIASGASLPTVPQGAFALQLLPNDKVSFKLPPARAPKDNASFAGVVSFTAVSAGLYQFTLSSDAWIDVIQDGAFVPTVAFSGKRDCPAVRKTVRFDLKEGSATLQLSGAPTDSIKLAVLQAQ